MAKGFLKINIHEIESTIYKDKPYQVKLVAGQSSLSK